MKVTVGVYGTGSTARHIARALKQMDDATLLYVCDDSLLAAEEFAEEFGNDATQAVDDPQQLVQAVSLQLVCLCVPCEASGPVCLDCFTPMSALGVDLPPKHTLSCLPLAGSPDIAKCLHEEARRCRALVVPAICAPIIYSESTKVLRQRLDEGFCGQVRRLEITAEYITAKGYDAAPKESGLLRTIGSQLLLLIESLGFTIKAVCTWTEYQEVGDERNVTGVLECETILSDGPVVCTISLLAGTPTEHCNLVIKGSAGALRLQDWQIVRGRRGAEREMQLFSPTPDEHAQELAGSECPAPHPDCYAHMMTSVCLHVMMISCSPACLMV